MRRTVRVVQMDGGGIMWLLAAYALLELEKKSPTGRLCDIIDLFYGSSTGAIAGAALAAGARVQDLIDMYLKYGPHIFHPCYSWMFPWLKLTRPWYARSRVLEPLAYILSQNNVTRLYDLKSKFVATTVDALTGKNEFIKSWKSDTCDMTALEAVNRSFAAVVAFGFVCDTEKKTYYGDGGTGSQNCALRQAYNEVEILKLDGVFPLDSRTVIYSFGTGYIDAPLKFEDVKNYTTFQQWYRVFMDGGAGLARRQAIADQLAELAWKQSKLGTDILDVRRFDMAVPAKMNKLDGIKYIDNYVEFGKQIAVSRSSMLNFD